MSKTLQAIVVDLEALAGALIIGFSAIITLLMKTFKATHPKPEALKGARLATGVAGICADLTVGDKGPGSLRFILMRDMCGTTLTADGKALLPGSICRSKDIETPYAERCVPLKDADVPPEHREAVSRLRRIFNAFADELAAAGYSRVWEVKNADGSVSDRTAEVAAARAEHRAEYVGPVSAFLGYGRFERKTVAPAAASSEAKFAGWAVPVPADAPKAKKAKARKA